VIASVAEGGVRLQSRQLRSLTRFFPEVVDALGAWFRDVVLDGVIRGREQGVHQVADRPGELTGPSLWTAYLWFVYDALCHPPEAVARGRGEIRHLLDRRTAR
jgi:ATP-dependent DNA ligase